MDEEVSELDEGWGNSEKNSYQNSDNATQSESELLLQDQSRFGNQIVGHASIEYYQQQLNQLRKENETLKAEILEKEQHLKKLKLIQTTQSESKLSTREENNIIKVLTVLADMEKKIDISKPYEAHGIMCMKAQLLGIDKFPSDESVKKWFTKAREYKKS